METNTLHIPPFFIEVDGCQVQVLEVLDSKLMGSDTAFHVVLTINYKGINSKTYSLDAKGTEDLVNKLKIEITKIKFLDYAHGLETVKRLII
jgi:hypothetical protein